MRIAALILLSHSFVFSLPTQNPRTLYSNKLNEHDPALKLPQWRGQLIMRRRDILLYLCAVFACNLGIMNNVNAASWVIDDGISEITPIYTMTHTYGQDFTFVRADFSYLTAKKTVKLQATGAISVNGVELKSEPGQSGTITYVGNIPLTEGKLTFKLVRSPTQMMEHSFELPILDVVAYPKSYRPHEPVRVPVRYVPSEVGTTVFNMVIHTSQRDFYFKSQIGSDYVEFLPIINVPLPAGTFEARIYRQQKTLLRDVSDANKTGWAGASNGRNFMIDVLGLTEQGPVVAR
jgi:hypothetical protein